MKNRAFTLVELLVVISIISFLSSIVLASLNTAREKGRIAAGQEFAASINHATGDELSGQWNFDANLKDSSGINSVTTNYGGFSYEQGVTGQAIRLSGSGKIVAITDTASFESTSFSVSLWVKPNSILNTTCPGYGCNGIMSKEEYTTKGFRFGYDSNLRPHFWTGENGGNFGVDPPKALQLGKFNYIVVTYDSSTQKASMYIDGQLVKEATGLYVYSHQEIQLNAGAWWNYYGDNSFDDVRYYTKSLTAREVGKVYAEGERKQLAILQE